MQPEEQSIHQLFEKSKVAKYLNESRLIVKNLPNHMTSERLKKLVATYGEVTDCKVIHTKEGDTRKFAFVGFKSNKQANNATYNLNNTFVDTSRVTVDRALPFQNTTIPRPWSKHSKGSSRHDKQDKPVETKQPEKTAAQKTREDKRLNEFLGIVNDKKKKDTKFWQNDLEAPKEKEAAPVVAEKDATVTNDDKNDNEEDEAPAKKRKLNDGKSDLDFLKSKTVATLDSSNDTSDNAIREPGITIPDETLEGEEEDVSETGRLYVINIPYTTSEDDLYELFRVFGDLSEIHMPIDKSTKQPKGFAYVLFMIPENAVKAMHTLNGCIFQGRMIHVIPARKKPEPKPSIADQLNEKSSFKKQQALKKKGEAFSQHNWNPLYMASNTVAQSMSKQLGVTKSELLDRDTDNAAVRLALAETEVVQQTKKAFEEHGVDFEALKNKDNWQSRSRTMILIKNIATPTNAEQQNDNLEEDLSKMFARYGSVKKVFLPPSRAMALIEFFEPTEAKAAFRGLAYKTFRHVPLYLEWAPSNVKQEQKDVPKKKQIKKAAEDKNPPNEMLFIKNLNFETTEDKLASIFGVYGVLSNVSVAKHADGRSKGYGFVKFEQLESSQKAHDDLAGYELDDHNIAIEYSAPQAGKKDQQQQPAKAPAKLLKKLPETFTDAEGRLVTFKKLVVRNVPFEATQKDLLQLFGTYGKVKTVRIPKKLTGGHRGFAFIEFLTAKECHAAYDALKNIHLYDRHLVLEFAADDNAIQSAQGKDEDVNMITQQVAKQEQQRENKKRKRGQD